MLNIPIFWNTSLFHLYAKTSDLEHVEEARKELFCQKWKAKEKLTPTQHYYYSMSNQSHIRLE